MSRLPRPTPNRQLRELARRLAEDYDSIPLPDVSRVVNEATVTTTGPDRAWSGTAEGIPAVVDIVEQLAREDLDELCRAGADRRPVRRERADARPPGAHRRGPRPGAE